MGFFTSITNSLFGKGGSGTAGEGVAAAKEYGAQATFNPYTVRTGFGGTSYDKDTGFQSNLSPELLQALSQSTSGYTDVLSAFQGFSPEERAQSIFDEQVAMLTPAITQMVQQQRGSLFGSGRLGQTLASEAQGLGEGGGLLNVGDVALNRSISQAYAPLAANARTQAMAEYGQLGQLSGGLMSNIANLTGLEQNLLGMGGTLEAQRGASYLGAGNLITGAYGTKAGIDQQQRGQNADFIGGMISAFAPVPGK